MTTLADLDAMLGESSDDEGKDVSDEKEKRGLGTPILPLQLSP